MGEPPNQHPAANTHAHFPQTRWSLVIAAGQSGGSRVPVALEDLCRAYWPPLYAEIRRRGHPPADAQDLTQAFFARLLRCQTFGAADSQKGRLRSFLLAALDCFLADYWREHFTQKRGGGVPVLSFDSDECESWHHELPATAATAAEVFDQQWALILMDRALEALRSEYSATGRSEIFETVQPFLAAETGGDGYDAACAKAGMTVDAFTVAVHRFRKRFRAAVRAQVEMTVAEATEVDAEMRHLFGA